MASNYNPVDGKGVPEPHFGVVLELEDLNELAARVKRQGVHFVIGLYTRFQGQPGEQETLFFLDPTGNALEFQSVQGHRRTIVCDLNDLLFKRQNIFGEDDDPCRC